MSRVDRKSYGGHSERETPGPIPNPEVKPFSADGTATERLWESRTPPDILVRRAIPKGMALLPFTAPLSFPSSRWRRSAAGRSPPTAPAWERLFHRAIAGAPLLAARSGTVG